MSAKSQDKLKFSEWLLNQVPFYDELILRDMDKPYLHPMPQDVWLLPNCLRRVYAARGAERKSAKRLGMSIWEFRTARDTSIKMLDQRLTKWIASLPKRRRSKEHKLRWFSSSDAWARCVKRGRFRGVEKSLDRFKAVFPNLKGNWQRA